MIGSKVGVADLVQFLQQSAWQGEEGCSRSSHLLTLYSQGKPGDRIEFRAPGDLDGVPGSSWFSSELCGSNSGSGVSDTCDPKLTPLLSMTVHLRCLIFSSVKLR